MAQVSIFPAPRVRAAGAGFRIALAAAAAAAVFTGALNLQLLFARGGEAAAPPGPSAIDTLVGVTERTETKLDLDIAALQAALRADDARTAGPAAKMLGFAYLQKARETGDPGYYPKVEALLQQTLAANPNDAEAMIGLGTLELARHQFAVALEWGERAKAINPAAAAVYGVIGDAQIELGRYDEAFQTIQTMVDLRPDLRSYSRVSYVRELMGDRDGAIAAMEQAATAGAGFAENMAWVQVQLGNVRFDGGDATGAARHYGAALAAVPGFAPALAGQAKVAAAEGDLDRAIRLYDAAVKTIPLPEFVVAYGDVLTAAGRPREAAAQYAVVEAIQQIYAANGVDTDLELALFTADYGDSAELPGAVERARAVTAARPSIFAWDALAWTLYRGGDYDGAAAASRKALHLGTRNALLWFHAGMIAAARGERAEAISRLETALALNPQFSVRFAPEARATLDRLRAGEEVR